MVDLPGRLLKWVVERRLCSVTIHISFSAMQADGIFDIVSRRVTG